MPKMPRFLLSVLFVLIVGTVVLTEGKKRLKKEKDCSEFKKGKPLCDQNGNIYSNLCEFKKSQKMLKKKNVVLERTRCPKATTPRPRISKPSKRARKIKQSKKEKKAMKLASRLEKCTTKPCSTVRNVSVCASNVTYPNYCVYKQARCKARLNGQRLVYYHKGPCGNPKPCVTYQSKIKEGICNADGTQRTRGHFVCASDGMTYQWPCAFLRAKCDYLKNNTGKELEVKRKRQKCEEDTDQY